VQVVLDHPSGLGIGGDDTAQATGERGLLGHPDQGSRGDDGSTRQEHSSADGVDQSNSGPRRRAWLASLVGLPPVAGGRAACGAQSAGQTVGLGVPLRLAHSVPSQIFYEQ